MNTDRRSFATMAGAAALTPLLGSKALAAATSTATDPLKGLTVINALGGFDDPNPRPAGVHRAPVTPRIIKDARDSGEAAVNITLGYVSGKDDPFESTVADVALWDRLVRENPHDLLKVWTAADILRAKAQNKIGLIYGFQNCAMMGDKASRVDIFADMGVRVFQLTYNPQNQLGGGSMAAEDTPLTQFGREVIDRLNARKVMVDLSHSGRQTCLDAARYSKQPISINHTGCRALNNVPRNKTDEELKLVADKGGFIGIYFMPFLDPHGHVTAAEVVANIEYAVNLCGEDHVGVGTDGGTTPIDDLGAYAEALVKEHAGRVANGVAAPGEGNDTHPFADDLRGPGQFRKLYRLLEAKGYSRTRIGKILGGNFLRYAKDIWGV